jgi:hypothetical protein
MSGALSSDGHGTGRDEIWLFIRPARFAKDFISRSRAFGARPAGVPGHLVHVMVDSMLDRNAAHFPAICR